MCQYFSVSVWYYFYLCFEMNSKKGVNEYYKSVTLMPINQIRRSLLTNLLHVQFVRNSLKTPQPLLMVKTILYEGTCSIWLHCKCTGLSKKAFQNLCSSNKPFLCSYCVINKHEEEITSLKSTIQVLTGQLSSIQAKLSDPDGFCESNVPKASSQVPQQKVAKPSQQSQSPSSFERNYNIVVYGIKKSAAKTTRSARSKRDQENLTPIFASIDPSIQNSSIKDFHRLGKYKLVQDQS